MWLNTKEYSIPCKTAEIVGCYAVADDVLLQQNGVVTPHLGHLSIDSALGGYPTKKKKFEKKLSWPSWSIQKVSRSVEHQSNSITLLLSTLEVKGVFSPACVRYYESELQAPYTSSQAKEAFDVLILFSYNLHVNKKHWSKVVFSILMKELFSYLNSLDNICLLSFYITMLLISFLSHCNLFFYVYLRPVKIALFIIQYFPRFLVSLILLINWFCHLLQ